MRLLDDNVVSVMKSLAPYFTEFIGTCMLLIVFACASTSAMYMVLNDDQPYYKPNVPQQPFAPLCIGAALMCLMYSNAHISGGHFNPAISLASYLSGKGQMSLIQLVGYTIVQLLAGILGAGLGYGIVEESGAPYFRKNTWWNVFGAEFMFTLGLCYVYLQVTSTKKTKDNGYFGLAVGFFLFTAVGSIGQVSGGFLNPAVTSGMFAIANAEDNINKNWYVYYFAQYLGAVASVGFFWLVNIGEEYEVDPDPSDEQATKNPVQEPQASEDPQEPKA